MRLLRAVVTAVLAVAGSFLAVLATGGPAAAHTHPTPVELVSPAVVRVETYAQVSISLIEHNRAGPHIGLLQRTYTPLLAAGSGFAVDPTGGIVTAPKVIDVDLKRAEIYAVNKIFNERYGNAAPLPADPFSRQTIKDVTPAGREAQRLQRCYEPNATDDSGGCVVFTTRVVKVLPFVSSQKLYGDLTATVLVPTAAGQSSDVVVLKVGASSMPTVNLATSNQGVTAFAALGFSAVPSNGASLQLLEGHFVGAGATEVKKDEVFDKLAAGEAAGVLGGPVVGEKGQVVGFLVGSNPSPAGPPTTLTLVGPDAVRKALSAAGIEARRGPTDAVYEDAMHNYKNKLYTPAIPSLEQTLKLYPGHALAAEALADANLKKGTAEDLTGRGGQTPAAQSSSGTSVRTVLFQTAAAVLVVVLIAALVIFLLRRRKRRASTWVDQSGAAEYQMAPTPGLPPQFAEQPGGEPMHESATMPIAPGVLAPTPAYTSPSPPGGQGFDPESTRIVAPGEIRPVPSAPPAPPAPPTWGNACPRCGQPVAPAQTFCGNCGQRLH